MGAPWPLYRSWQLVQRLALGREPGAPAACGGLGLLLAALQVPACFSWNPYLPWQALVRAVGPSRQSTAPMENIFPTE